MEISSKVVSLDLAKRMKELGWTFETERYWVIFYNNSSTTPLKEFEQLVRVEELEELKEKSYIKILEIYPAPDAIEIGGELPTLYYSQKAVREDFKWACYVDDCSSGHKAQWADTEAEARGKMWCYLREKGLI